MTVIQYPSAHASDPLLTYAVTVLYLIPVLFQLRGRAIDVGGLVKEGGPTESSTHRRKSPWTVTSKPIAMCLRLKSP